MQRLVSLLMHVSPSYLSSVLTTVLSSYLTKLQVSKSQFVTKEYQIYFTDLLISAILPYTLHSEATKWRSKPFSWPVEFHEKWICEIWREHVFTL